MGKAKAVAKVAAIGAAIGGVIFFWRKRQHHDEAGTGGYPSAADAPEPSSASPGASSPS